MGRGQGVAIGSSGDSVGKAKGPAKGWDRLGAGQNAVDEASIGSQDGIAFPPTTCTRKGQRKSCEINGGEEETKWHSGRLAAAVVLQLQPACESRARLLF